LLPGVSGYIAAEKKKVSGRLMAVALHIFPYTPERNKEKSKPFRRFLLCANRDALAFFVGRIRNQSILRA